jgi:hypothetical protein
MKKPNLFVRLVILAASASLILSACDLPKATPPVIINPVGSTSTPTVVPGSLTEVPTVASVPPSAVPPTGVPPTAVPPTAVPPTAVPPTTVPTTPELTPIDKDVNCRFGPSTNFLSVGFVKVGQTVPIHGTIPDHSWWQIQNPQDVAGHFCWVGGSVVKTLGDISLVAVVAIPTALVTDVTVSVSPGSVVHGTCGGPNPVSFSVSITTNGPTSVGYYIQIFNSDNTNRTPQLPATLTFASASTQTFDPGGSYHTDCGSYYIKAVVTSPNSLSAKADWKVVSP